MSCEQDIFIYEVVKENNVWIGCILENGLECSAVDIIYNKHRLQNAVVVFRENTPRIRTKSGYDTIKVRNIENKLTLYHAASVKVKKPIWNYAVKNASGGASYDFGPAFYVSEDTEQPKKLGCTKFENVVLNKYEVNLEGLKVLYLNLDEDWLLTVCFHRRDFKKKLELRELREEYRNHLKKFDIIVGPVADDTIFTAISNFIEGNTTSVVTLKLMDVMGYPYQYAFVSDKACEALKFKGCVVLKELEKEEYLKEVTVDRERIAVGMQNVKERYSREGRFIYEILRDRGVNDDKKKHF